VSYAWESLMAQKWAFVRLADWLQEESLDEIDTIAASPFLERNPRRSDEFVHDFIREKTVAVLCVYHALTRTTNHCCES